MQNQTITVEGVDYPPYRINVYDADDRMESYHYCENTDEAQKEMAEYVEKGVDAVLEERVETNGEYEYESARLFCCESCGGGFLEGEMNFEAGGGEDDFCIGCS